MDSRTCQDLYMHFSMEFLQLSNYIDIISILQNREDEAEDIN